MAMSKTKELALTALLAALVVILQFLSLAARAFLPFAISLSLIPIIIGAALIGPKTGGILGLVSALVILYTDAGAFLAVDVKGTIITVILKGVISGVAAGFIYRFSRMGAKRMTSVFYASIVCTLLNTLIFLIGVRLFFWDTVSGWALAAGYEETTVYVFTALVGVNFLIELATTVFLSPTIFRLIKISNSKQY